MAWTAGSFPTKIRAVSGLGYKGEPFTLHGYLLESDTHREGDVLIKNAGSLDAAGDLPDGSTVLGVLTSISPLATAASQTPRERATNATVPDRTKYDADKSIPFYVWVPGNIFMGHLTLDATTDDTADSNLHVYVDHAIRKATNDFSFGVTVAANKGAGFTLGFVNPQTSTITGTNTFVNSPGPVKDSIGDANGTKNPLVTSMPNDGEFITST